MGSPFKHFKFFRFRTSCHIDGYGVTANIFWLANSLKLIDFTDDDLLQEAIFICRVIPGCFSFDNLREMPYTTYDKILEIAKEINKKNG